MLFYTISNALLLLWAALFCFRKPSRSKNLFFLLLSFGQLFLMMAFRYNVGSDYDNYYYGYTTMKAEGFGNLTFLDWEPGFVIFTKLMAMIPGMDYQIYLIIISLIAIVPMAIFLYKESEIPWLSTILYVNMLMYFMSLNFLRQMIAVSLLMLAWVFLKRNKFFRFLLMIIVASLFHQTVLLMIPVYFIVKIKPGLKELLIYGFFLLWFYTASSNIIDLITSFYHEDYNNSEFIREGVSAVYSILPVFITVVAFILVKTETINLTTENKYLVNLSFIGTITMLTMSKHAIIERLSYYFILFMLLLVPVIYKSLKVKGINYTNADGKTIVLTSQKARTVLSVGFLLLVLGLSYLHFYFGLSENAHEAAHYSTWLKLF